jgi:hypothetical protein
MEVVAMTQHDKLRPILVESIRDHVAQIGLRMDVTEDTQLLGGESALDSLGLVTVLACFEAGINDTFGTEIVLVDERAMSMERSPFRTVASLVDYASALLDKNGNAS